MVADIEELGKLDASESHARRLNATEVLTPLRSDNFMFALAEGVAELFGKPTRAGTTCKEAFKNSSNYQT